MEAIASNNIKIQTGDEVLVRDTVNELWEYKFFSHVDNKDNYPFKTSCGDFKQCIPYKGNEHLVGTTNNFVIPKKSLTYKEKQKQWIEKYNIKVGDKVRIIKKSFKGDNGCNINWFEEKNLYIGQIGIITEIENNCISIIFKNNHEFYFPYHVLEKIEDKSNFRFGAKVKAYNDNINNYAIGILIDYQWIIINKGYYSVAVRDYNKNKSYLFSYKNIIYIN